MKLGELIKTLNVCEIILGEMYPERAMPFVHIRQSSSSNRCWGSYANREVASITVSRGNPGLLLVGIKPE